MGARGGEEKEKVWERGNKESRERGDDKGEKSVTKEKAQNGRQE